MLLLPLLGDLLLAGGFLRPLCLLHGPPLLISGCWALQSLAFFNNLISCLLCMLPSMQARTSFTYMGIQLPLCNVRVSVRLLLVSFSGYHLFLLCHPYCFVTMAPVSMALHVTYMRSLCKKEWRTGRQMMLLAVRHGVTAEFIQF